MDLRNTNDILKIKIQKIKRNTCRFREREKNYSARAGKISSFLRKEVPTVFGRSQLVARHTRDINVYHCGGTRSRK